MTRFLSIDDVHRLHRDIIVRAGTRAGIRDFALLHSAVERPKATFAGRDLYPTIFAKAAALLESICLNHPFTDGNKRTAWAATKLFLFINGFHLQAETDDGVDFMIRVDNNKPGILTVTRWLKEHSGKTKEEI